MKKMILVICLFAVFGGHIQGQKPKVLLKAINGQYKGDEKRGKADGQGIAKGIDTYVGEFKKGLPHGKGVYTWANGDIYDGEWVKGRKDGAGTLITKMANEKDSILKGYWERDKYIGLYKSTYQKIDKSPNISAYSVKEVGDISGVYSIRFYLKVDQKQVYNPQLKFSLHHGEYQDIKFNSNYVELTKVTFPIKLKAYYQRDYIEIEILKPGLWDVRTEITQIKGLN